MKTITKTLVSLFLLTQLLVSPRLTLAEGKDSLGFNTDNIGVSWGKLGIIIGVLIAIQIAITARSNAQISKLKSEVNNLAKVEAERRTPSLESLVGNDNVKWTSNRVNSNENSDTYMFIAEVERATPKIELNAPLIGEIEKANTQSNGLLLFISVLVILGMVTVIW